VQVRFAQASEPETASQWVDTDLDGSFDVRVPKGASTSRSQRQQIEAVPCSNGPNELGYRRNNAPPAKVKCVHIRRWFVVLQANTASVALALALLLVYFFSILQVLHCAA